MVLGSMQENPYVIPLKITPNKERKGKEEYLYSAILVRTHTLRALRHGSHSFTCKQHHACLHTWFIGPT